MTLDLIQTSASVIAIGFAWLAWQRAHEHFRWSRTLAFIERLNGPEMTRLRLEVMKEASSWRLADGTVDTRAVDELHPVATTDAAIELDKKITVIGNLLQELGVAWRHGAVDKVMTANVFNGIVTRTWAALRPYTDRCRDANGRVCVWEDFQMLVREISQYDYDIRTLSPMHRVFYRMGLSDYPARPTAANPADEFKRPTAN